MIKGENILAGVLSLTLLAGCGGMAGIPETPLPEESVSAAPVPAERVPVLTGGALPFTGMKNLRTENNPDGTYFYEDVTQDGQITVVNAAEPCAMVPEVQDEEDYYTACALSLGDAVTYELLFAREDGTCRENLGLDAAWVVGFTAGENEDMRTWTVLAAGNDKYTYLYGFGAAPEAEEGMEEIFEEIFGSLRLEDGA